MLSIALRQRKKEIKKALLSVFICAEQRLFSLFLASSEGKIAFLWGRQRMVACHTLLDLLKDSVVFSALQIEYVLTFRLKGTDVKCFTLGRERLHVLMYGRSLLCQDWIIIAIIIIRIIN